MNAYELATVEDAAIQYAKAVPHASQQAVSDPASKGYFREPTADDVLGERGFTFGERGSADRRKWHELVREIVRIGALKARGKYQMTPRLKGRATRMRHSGKTLEEIGAVLGYDYTTIMRNLR